MDLTNYRRFFAEELQAVANLKSNELVEAFATIPRENFLGDGPWQVWQPVLGGMSGFYRTTPDNNPKHLYHNILIAIDAAKQLNNGQPSTVAGFIDALELKASNKVLHIGCGLGYYTAIMATIVGFNGYVTAVEMDEGLSLKACQNLAYLENVEVINLDGSKYIPKATDAILVNAGVTHPHPSWLEKLNMGGRLVLPLTVTSIPNTPGAGFILKVKRVDKGYEARFVSPVSIFSLSGMRDETLNKKLLESIKHGTMASVRSLRVDKHQQDGSCWLHSETFCLSSLSLS
jgi:protein-L-isoaspartate(D-aspartate) O-methyltransferase